MPFANMDVSSKFLSLISFQEKLQHDAINNGRTTFSNILVGFLMMLISAACVTAYVFILQAIFCDKDLIKMTSYKFMFLLGVFDVFQCLPHFMTGIFTIFQTTWHPVLPKIMGVIATPSYVGYVMLTLILSFQRFLQLLSKNWEDRLFTGIPVIFWIGCGFVPWFAFAIALALPGATIEYHPEWYSWYYNEYLPLSGYVQQSEMYFEIIAIALSAVFYALVILLLVYKRHRFTSSTNYTAELKILIQAGTVTVYAMILNVVWHNYEMLLPESIWSYMTFNFMWICSSGVYPTIYIIVNRAIRTKIVKKRNSSFVIPRSQT